MGGWGAAAVGFAAWHAPSPQLTSRIPASERVMGEQVVCHVVV